MQHLILGGARSGKSRFAERLAINSGRTVLYIATAQALDEEMKQRIHRHQMDRPDDWQTIESSFDLVETLRRFDDPDRLILVDCLTLWLSNFLCFRDEQAWRDAHKSLLACLPELQADVLFVSNEVGQGIMPDNALSRRFVDEAGWLHQDLAALCEQVTLVVAGLPVTVK